MTDTAAPSTDPRWGGGDRDLKGRAILGTVRRLAGDDVLAGAWLDIGCGSGEIALELSQSVAAVTGIDPEPWERWNDFVAEHANLDFLQGGYRELESRLGVASMDVVVCNQVYEHVDDPDALMQQIHRVLKPGGLCYFAGPNLWWPIEPHVKWAFVHWLPRRFAQRLMTLMGSRDADDLDARLWSWFRLVRMFRRHGFEYRNALLERVFADAGPSSTSLAFRIAVRLPQGIADVLAPLAPAFVFLLRKPE